ncbi:hypothetical protein PG993_014044 [Apiospora rasikravindrae]|uniref:Uncharacterized protein n=1 Tax=Apiospora rasikravindrae TaxID=990691 RepID=A0ABR1RTZ0_9PEZI
MSRVVKIFVTRGFPKASSLSRSVQHLREQALKMRAQPDSATKPQPIVFIAWEPGPVYVFGTGVKAARSNFGAVMNRKGRLKLRPRGESH